AQPLSSRVQPWRSPARATQPAADWRNCDTRGGVADVGSTEETRVIRATCVGPPHRRTQRRSPNLPRVQGTSCQPDCPAHGGDLSPGSPRRAPCPARAADLSDGLSSLVLPSALQLTTTDTCFRFFTPAPTPRLPWARWPTSARLAPARAGVPSAA